MYMPLENKGTIINKAKKKDLEYLSNRNFLIIYALCCFSAESCFIYSTNVLTEITSLGEVHVHSCP